MNNARVASLIFVLVGAGAAAAMAGAPPRGTLDPSGFERVDPLMDDTGALRTSLRDLGIDLRQGDNFSSVYRIPGSRPDGANDRFARRSGGITAVFPQSVYVPTREGVIADIPPGTVFYLNGIPAPRPWDHVGLGGGGGGGGVMRRPESAPTASLRMNTAIDRSVGAGNVAAGVGVDAGIDGAMVHEEAPMFVGVRRLLMQAAERGEGGVVRSER